MSLRGIEPAVHIRERRWLGIYEPRHPGTATRRLGTAGAAKPADEVVTEFGAESAPITASERHPVRRPSASLSANYQEAIELGLSRDRNPMAIRQDLVNSCGFNASYQSVQRFVRKPQISIPAEARAVIEATY
jgi:hypothetical protein